MVFRSGSKPEKTTSLFRRRLPMRHQCKRKKPSTPATNSATEIKIRVFQNHINPILIPRYTHLAGAGPHQRGCWWATSSATKRLPQRALASEDAQTQESLPPRQQAQQQKSKSVFSIIYKSIGGWGGRTRTFSLRHQKPLPYHLATPQQEESAQENTDFPNLAQGRKE